MSKLDQLSQWIEQPVRSATRSHRLNPLPHAGTISVFLLGVVVVSGLYITLFFEFGFEASYRSVQGLEQHPIQRVMRALHRYSSAALVATTAVHGWRIFAGGRFTARRRFWRWSTGLASLVLVWLAGVTGYWLIWDVRAQAINESAASLLGWSDWGARISVRHLIAAPDSASGSWVLVAIWFAHIGLTMTIGWFVWRHLRRTQLSFVPPRHWMVLMGGSLLVMSVSLPLGMLGPADPTALVGEMPLDPFVMFLLPPLLSQWRWAALVGMGTLMGCIWLVPRVMGRNQAVGPVTIDHDSCTGCDLCVADCPYLALTMVDTPTRADKRASRVAQVDPSACVGCGICLGSCAFGAIALEGAPDPVPVEVRGRRVVLACDRHANHIGQHNPDHNETTDGDQVVDPVVFSVRCAGMFNQRAIADLVDAGASGVQMLGCPPSDCRYGIGNSIASQRLQGTRSPHLPRRISGLIAEDWVAPSDAPNTIVQPGIHRTVSAEVLPTQGRRVMTGAAVVVALSVAAIGVATQTPFRPAGEVAELRVVVDHTPGSTIVGQQTPTGSPGTPIKVSVSVGETVIASRQVGNGDRTVTTFFDLEIGAGSHDLIVTLNEGDDRSTLFNDTVDLEPGKRLIVSAIDASGPADAEQGRNIFYSSKAACSICHSIEPGSDGVGPSLAGIGTTAATRVDGLSAEYYLRQSLLLPDQYVVEGYRPGQMLPIYRDQLDEHEREAIIAYLLTLESEQP